MRRYVFLDAWLLSRLSDERAAAGMSRFLRERQLVPVSTTLTFVEIFNPGWKEAVGRERGQSVAAFLAEHPCVIVDPTDVLNAEYEAYPERLAELPTRLDLANIERALREKTLVAFLRSDPVFRDQEKDIAKWATGYAATKAAWLAAASQVVDDLLRDAGVTRRPDGTVHASRVVRETALLSLDLRLLENADADEFLSRVKRRSDGRIPFMRGARATSLAMWHLYAAVNPRDRLAQHGSDIGDILHLALAPYCEVFTTDGTMQRLLRRIGPELGLDPLRVFGPSTLEPLLRRG